MTDSRVTQAGVLILSDPVDPEARSTQAVALALGIPQPDARTTQAGALALLKFLADERTTQTPVLVLADHMPCLTRWAQTWLITRQDGQQFAYTTLDRPLTFHGITYQPCESLIASASESSTAAGSTGSMELSGTITDAGIKEEELFQGLFDGATVEVWNVPWINAGGETPVRLMAGTTGDSTQGVLGFTAEVISPGAKAQQKPLLDVYTPQCRWKLGDTRCTVDLSALTVSGTVTASAIPAAPNSATRRTFTDTSRTEATDFFNYGSVTFTSGLNNGLSAEVKSFSNGTFVLWAPVLHPISVGDTYTARPGCDKAPDTCKTKFDNFDNYGGFPDVPGQDAIIKTPNAR